MTLSILWTRSDQTIPPKKIGQEKVTSASISIGTTRTAPSKHACLTRHRAPFYNSNIHNHLEPNMHHISTLFQRMAQKLKWWNLIHTHQLILPNKIPWSGHWKILVHRPRHWQYYDAQFERPSHPNPFWYPKNGPRYHALPWLLINQSQC